MKYFFLLVMFFLQGCVPGVNKWTYLSLEDNKNIQITELESLEYLYFADSFPKSYLIDNEKYKVEISYTVGQSEFILFAASSDGTALEIRPMYIDQDIPFLKKCVIFYGNEAIGYDYLGNYGKVFDYTYRPSCSSYDNILKFSIHDENGALLGIEELTFEIKQNGWYVYYDAI